MERLEKQPKIIQPVQESNFHPDMVPTVSSQIQHPAPIQNQVLAPDAHECPLNILFLVEGEAVDLFRVLQNGVVNLNHLIILAEKVPKSCRQQIQ